MRTLQQCQHIYDELTGGVLGGFQAAANARYILYAVKEINMPYFALHLDESLGIEAYLYISIAFDFHKHGDATKSEECFERAGTILEYVNRDKAHQDDYSQYNLLISALSYYCAGQISKAYVVAKEISNEIPIGLLIKLWLHKDFDELLVASEMLLMDEVENTPDVAKVYAKCFSKVIAFIQHGDFALLDSALNDMNQTLRKALTYGEPDLWIVSALMAHIFGRLKETSLWAHVPKLGDNVEIIKAYIHNLFYSHHPIFELFKTQIEALDIILRGEGAVVSLPTSSGKTRIAELAILKALMADPESAILYLAPFRSLAYEVENGYESVFNPLRFYVSHLYGSNDFSYMDRLAMNESSIWIATPEKAKAIFRCGGFSKRISLVILDEGHLIDETDRYAANEMFTEELRTRVEADGGQFLLLSAVLPNAQDIAQWLAKDANNNIVSNWRISSQRTGIILNYPAKVKLEWDRENRCYNNNFVRGPLDWKAACANVAQRIQSLGAVLVYVAKARWVNAQAEAIYTVIQQEPDVDWEGDVDWDKFVLMCREEDPKGVLLKYAQKGILCHNANMTDSVRVCMDRLLRKGKAKYVVATNTLAQGVNIGVTSVIFATIDRLHGEYISKRDFWNVAGRAGRAFVDTEGRVLFYCDARNDWFEDDQKTRAWEYMGNQQIENVQSGVLTNLLMILTTCEERDLSIDQIENLLEHDDYALIPEEESTIQSKMDVIDDSILSIILENESSMNKIEQQIDKSLAVQQADVAAKAKIRRMLFARYKRNQAYAMQHEYLAYTGMALNDAETLYGQLETIQSALQDYRNSEQNLEDLLIITDKIEDIVLSLPTKRITKIEKCILDANRRTWLSGGVIKKVTDRKNIVKFYQFSTSWVLNAISSYYSNVQHDEALAKLLVRINYCLQYGLPTYSACRVYQAGIKSRQSAIELSPLVEEYSDEKTYMVRRVLLNIQNAEGLSESAKAWLNVLHKEENVQQERIMDVPPCSIHLNEDNPAEILYVYESKEKYYVRNVDYSFIQQIDPGNYNTEKVADVLGLFFAKTDKCHYELVSENERYQIKKG